LTGRISDAQESNASQHGRNDATYVVAVTGIFNTVRVI
jgi:hypothetical protein